MLIKNHHCRTYHGKGALGFVYVTIMVVPLWFFFPVAAPPPNARKTDKDFNMANIKHSNSINGELYHRQLNDKPNHISLNKDPPNNRPPNNGPPNNRPPNNDPSRRPPPVSDPQPPVRVCEEYGGRCRNQCVSSQRLQEDYSCEDANKVCCMSESLLETKQWHCKWIQ